MKEISELKFPDAILYTARHIWVKPDGDTLLAGITDYAQDQLGEVVYIDLPEEGIRHEAGQDFGNVESVKSVNQLFMPVTGEIVAVNTRLADNPELVNRSCYDEGWIMRIKPDAPEDAEKLLSAETYVKSLRS